MNVEYPVHSYRATVPHRRPTRLRNCLSLSEISKYNERAILPLFLGFDSIFGAVQKLKDIISKYSYGDVHKMKKKNFNKEKEEIVFFTYSN